MADKFVVSERVRLKGLRDSPEMLIEGFSTIESITRYAHCVWFDYNLVLYTHTFPLEMLVPLEPKQYVQ